jgi:hypothetical protein
MSSSHSSGSWSIKDLVFLSYSRADGEQVAPIADALRARGATVWYDTASTAGGSYYIESVRRALRNTALMLVFVSGNSVSSNWVADELRAYRSLMARETGHKLLAVHLDKTRIPPNLQDASAIDAHGVPPAEVARLIGQASGLAALAPTPSDGSVYLTHAGSDWARVQPLVAALQARGVRFADSAPGGLRSAQTLLVALSTASATSPVVSEEVETFGSLAVNDPARSIIGIQLDQSASTYSLNGATAVDASTLSVDDAAQSIITVLPVTALGSASATSTAPVAVTEPEPAIESEPVTVEPVDSGPVYFAFAGGDWAKAQALATALRRQGVTLTDNTVGGLRSAQTLLVGQSAAAASSLAVADDLSAFQSVAVGDPTRKIIGVQLESGASAPNLGAASVIDGSFMSADDVVQSIVTALPKGAAETAPVAEPAPMAESAPAQDETAKVPVVVSPAVDHTDAAPAMDRPTFDPIQTATGESVAVVTIPPAEPMPAPEVAPVAAPTPAAETAPTPEPSPSVAPPVTPAAEAPALAQSSEAGNALSSEKVAAPDSGLRPFLIGVVALIVAIALVFALALLFGHS